LERSLGKVTRKQHKPSVASKTAMDRPACVQSKGTSVAKTTRKPTAKKTTRKKSTSAKSSKPTKKSATRSRSKTGTSSATARKSRKSPAKKRTAGEIEVSVDRRRSDRRTKSEPVGAEQTKLERREKVNRRRQIDPTTCERDYSDAEVEFMNALDDYKRASGRMFPTCSEVLEVIRKLGYVKVAADPSSPSEEGSKVGHEETATVGAVSADQNAEGVMGVVEDDFVAAEELLV